MLLIEIKMRLFRAVIVVVILMCGDCKSKLSGAKRNGEVDHKVVLQGKLLNGSKQIINSSLSGLMKSLASTQETLAKRSRRAPEDSFPYCRPGQTTCCLHKFVKSTRELDLGIDIVEPTAFNLNFCSGSCGVGSLRQRVIKAEINTTLCCHVSSYAPLQVSYRTDSTMRTQTLSNMVAVKCDCS